MQCYAPLKSLVEGKDVAVVGIGVSNVPLIHLLLRLGAKVTACDRRDEKDLGTVYQELSALGVEFCLGEGYLGALTQKVIFKTPGMRYDLPELEEAKANGAVVTSEMEQFFELCPAKIFGITGSDGKTTTSTIVYELLKTEGHRCWLGGNIGTPLLDKISEMNPDDRVVLELSSFQLHTLRKSPQVAVMTNITPNHLDMHKDYQEYIDAKKNIMLYQNDGDVLVTNSKNEITRQIGTEAKGEQRCFSSAGDAMVCLKNGAIYYGDEFILETSDIKIPGRHNVLNYMAAYAATAEHVSPETVKKIAVEFGGVEHRIELVRELDGVKYYNSSIDSTPTRTAAALSSFKEKVIVICGGYDKNLSYDPLAVTLCEKAKAVVVTGACAPKILAALEGYEGYKSSGLRVYKEPIFESAVKEERS